MSTKKVDQTEPIKRTRKPRRQNPFMLVEKCYEDTSKETTEYLVIPVIQPEAKPDEPPINNSFASKEEALKAAALIPVFCQEKVVHIIQVFPWIKVTTKTRTTMKL